MDPVRKAKDRCGLANRAKKLESQLIRERRIAHEKIEAAKKQEKQWEKKLKTELERL